MRLDVLKAMNAARRERRAGVVVTRLADGDQRFVGADALGADLLAAEIEAALRMGKSVAVTAAGEDYFLTVQAPSPRLTLIGAVHISQALAPMARIAGLDVTIIDPRTAFATPERFPETPVLAQWPDEALAAQPLDRFTAICLLTHDPKIDDPALTVALKADCFYIGALGSRKTHAKRIERMRALGFDETALARIHAPIGLDIGAVSPAEIAVSILGEIVASLRKKPLRSESAAA
jgi:xanthine dehydrogenase accessory factor